MQELMRMASHQEQAPEIMSIVNLSTPPLITHFHDTNGKLHIFPPEKGGGNLSGTGKLRRRGNQIFLKDACRRQDAAIQAIIASFR